MRNLILGRQATDEEQKVIDQCNAMLGKFENETTEPLYIVAIGGGGIKNPK